MKSLKVLIITSEPGYQDTYRQLFDSLGTHYELIQVSSLDNALKTLQKPLIPDCLIVHFTARDADGLKILQLISHQSEDSPLPAVIITDNPSQLTSSEYFNQHNHDYLLEAMLTAQTLAKTIGDVIEKTLLNQKVDEQELTVEHLTYYDALTDLSNRLLFETSLTKTIARSRRYNRCMAILFLDLDNFKAVNDALGHRIGDLLLKEIALRLKPTIRSSDLLARLGGDEFGVILEEIEQFYGAGIFANRIVTAMQAPFLIENHQLFMTTSIGIACFPESGTSAEELIKNADAALFRVKENGGNGYQYFTTEMNTRLLEYMETKNALIHGLENQDFRVHYQPKFNLSTQKICGLEALVRWQRSAGVLAYPDSFIPIAEQLGFITPLSYWILNQVCKDICYWRQLGIFQPVAINLSVRQLKEPDFIERVTETLAQYHLNHSAIEFELTESMIMADSSHALTVLEHIRKLGFAISIDDFGTGYSSLCYLKWLPVTGLKVDRCFIEDLGKSPQDKQIVESIISLGRAMGLKIIAEGIETLAQLEELKRLGCEEGQGFYLCVPNTRDVITPLLTP